MWVTTDRIQWLFKTRLSHLTEPKLVIGPEDFHITHKNVIDKVEVKYHFLNTKELFDWCEMIQGLGEPDKSFKKIIRSRG